MTDRTPRIDRIAATFTRQGPCAHCGRKVTRQRTFQDVTNKIVDGKTHWVSRALSAWEALPLLHPRCELPYENAQIRRGLAEAAE